MTLMTAGMWLFKHAFTRYTSAQLADDIAAIHKRITDVYSDMATAHFNAAQDAALALEHSTSPHAEVRAVIGHLREAFSILDGVAEKRVQKRVLVVFKREEYVLEDRMSVHLSLAHLAALIAVMYGFLREPESFQRWKQQASKAFATFLTFVDIAPHVLMSIDERYVQKVMTTVYHPGIGDGDFGYEETQEETIVLPSGLEYIEHYKTEAQKQFLAELDSVSVDAMVFGHG